MDEQGRLFGKINIIDFLVIFFAAMALIILLVFSIGNITSGKFNFAFKQREQDIVKKEDILKEKEKELTEQSEKEKLQSWIEGVKEGIRLNIK